MKVVVDQDVCEGYARCVAAAPMVFALGDDDRSHVLIDHPDEELRPQVERAVSRCPRQAIRLIEGGES